MGARTTRTMSDRYGTGASSRVWYTAWKKNRRYPKRETHVSERTATARGPGWSESPTVRLLKPMIFFFFLYPQSALISLWSDCTDLHADTCAEVEDVHRDNTWVWWLGLLWAVSVWLKKFRILEVSLSCSVKATSLCGRICGLLLATPVHLVDV